VGEISRDKEDREVTTSGRLPVVPYYIYRKERILTVKLVGSKENCEKQGYSEQLPTAQRYFKPKALGRSLDYFNYL